MQEKQVMRDYMKGDKTLDKAYGKPELYIKCSSKDASCNCPTKKKKHFIKWKMSKARSKSTLERNGSS